jgi:2,4-dienoyl-CoA reductase-like NADH-dependent reductase (Old Yellow Enzyme family)
MSLLFSKTSLGPLTLQNRLVMSPLTRNRAINNVPNDLMAEYYAQRASVGLIITEGTSGPRTEARQLQDPEAVSLCVEPARSAGGQRDGRLIALRLA